MDLYLHKRYPKTAEKLPTTPLREVASPVAPMHAFANRAGMRHLYIKRDDLACTPVGGTVVRKLEFILGHAERKAFRNITTFGALGSELSSALAAYAPPRGIKPKYFAYTQGTGRREIRFSQDAAQKGLIVHPTNSRTMAQFSAYRERIPFIHSPTLHIPTGGGPRGALGWVEAALELKAQIDAAKLPAPDVIFLPTTTGAGLAGLVVGLSLAAVPTRVVGVQTVGSAPVSLRRIRALSDRTIALLRGGGCRDATPPALEQVTLLKDVATSASREPTRPSQIATALARDTERLHLDPAVTGRVLAAILDQALSWPKFRDSKVLFWNTSTDR